MVLRGHVYSPAPFGDISPLLDFIKTRLLPSALGLRTQHGYINPSRLPPESLLFVQEILAINAILILDIQFISQYNIFELIGIFC